MSVDKDQIEGWVREGTISQVQADKMLADTKELGQEKSSSRFVVALSTIGAILLGVGAILFIASNWEVLSDIAKTLILVVATLGAYGVGYYFKYKSGKLPKVGSSLIFLGALLFGATIFLVAQIYNVNANNHTLLLVWLIGILPLVYALASTAMASLAALLFFVWLAFFMLDRFVENWAYLDTFLLRMPALYISAGVLVFGIGAFHYLSDRLKSVARTYRLFGIKISMLALFLLTFEFFSSKHVVLYDVGFGPDTTGSPEFTMWFVIFSIVAVILSAANLFFNPSRSQHNKLESGISLVLLASAMTPYFYPSETSVYAVFFNLLMAAIVIAIIYIGYHREDMQVVNAGLFWAAALIIARYFDFFWKLLDRSVFFMVGGLILVLGGIALERKRRQIKSKFAESGAITQ